MSFSSSCKLYHYMNSLDRSFWSISFRTWLSNILTFVSDSIREFESLWISSSRHSFWVFIISTLLQSSFIKISCSRSFFTFESIASAKFYFTISHPLAPFSKSLIFAHSIFNFSRSSFFSFESIVTFYSVCSTFVDNSEFSLRINTFDFSRSLSSILSLSLS